MGMVKYRGIPAGKTAAMGVRARRITTITTGMGTARAVIPQEWEA